MNEPISTVVKVASTPDQARIYVAMLEAEGIPAFVDGNSSADEFAMICRCLSHDLPIMWRCFADSFPAVCQ